MRVNRPPQIVPQRVDGVLRRLEQRTWVRVGEISAGIARDVPSSSTIDEADRLSYARLDPGDIVARAQWGHSWIRLVPATPPPTCTAYLWFICDGESTLYASGQPWAGYDVAHRYWPVPMGETPLYLRHGLYQTGIWKPDETADLSFGLRYRDAFIATRDDLAWEVFWDLKVLRDVLHEQLKRDGIEVSLREGYNEPLVRATRLTRILIDRLDRVCDELDADRLSEAKQLLTDAYSELPAASHDPRVTVTGHAHMDLVWLWPEHVTLAKMVHTFASVERLAELYPAFVFQQSSPHLLRQTWDQAPGQRGRLRRLSEAGRVEQSGAADLEFDLNLTSGEGLVRSLLYGQHYYRDETGSNSPLLWLPDVFGYPDCVPQLLQQADVDYFFTTKLRWSSINRFPHTAFEWVGADGSRVLAYVSPTRYNGGAQVGDVTLSAEANAQSALGPGSLLPAGYGDGGGGPTFGFCERVHRMNSLAGVGQVRWGTPIGFFHELASVRQRLPVYQGELYLEYHRGTYTSQARFKRLVAEVERQTLQLEAVRAVRGKEPLSYADWNRLILCQFHDAIPGSSIGAVYDDLSSQLRERAGLVSAETDQLLSRREGGWSLFNPTIADRVVTVGIPDECDLPVDATQVIENGDRIAIARLPGLCLVALEDAVIRPDAPATATPDELSNGRVTARFSSDGSIRSLEIDGAETVLVAGRLVGHKDRPAAFDAWDIDRAAADLAFAVDARNPRVTEHGPLRVAVQFDVELPGGSCGLLEYGLAAARTVLEVKLNVDWGERDTLLKYAVETSLRATSARFGTPFGSVRRQTRPGGSREEAQWEVPARGWAALTDDHEGHGIVLMSEANYGYAARSEHLSLSLLRSPGYPDPGCDRGWHTIRWAIGTYRDCSTSQQHSTPLVAETIYSPVWIGRASAMAEPVVALEDAGSVVPTSVKPAEDGRGFVVRLHETHGVATECVLRLSAQLTRATVFRDDILERDVEALAIEDGRIRVRMAAFQIATIRIHAAIGADDETTEEVTHG